VVVVYGCGVCCSLTGSAHPVKLQLLSGPYRAGPAGGGGRGVSRSSLVTVCSFSHGAEVKLCQEEIRLPLSSSLKPRRR
jgi:hypothetical protein